MRTSLVFPVIVLFVVTALLFIMVSIITSSRRREYVHFFFSLFLASAAVWSAGLGVFLLSRDERLAYLAATIYYIAAAVIVYALVVLVLSIPAGSSKTDKAANIKTTGLYLVIPVLVMIIITVVPRWLIVSVNISSSNTVTLNPTGYVVYAIIFLFYAVSSSYVSFFKLHKAKEPKYRRQLLYIAGSALFGIGFGSFFDLILPLFGNYYLIWVGPLCSIPVVSAIFYSIVRHGLFDIRRVVIRTVAYVMSLFTLALVYYFLAFIISVLFLGQSYNIQQNITSAAIAIILAFVFQPTKKFFDHLTNKFFFRDGYDTDDFYAKLNETLTHTNDLRGLLERAANEIGGTLKSEQAFFFIYTSNDHYVSAGTARHRQLPRNDATRLEMASDMVDDVVVASILEIDDPVRRLMVSHRIELVLPLTQAGTKIGFLCLGERKTAHYTARDMRVLSTIADELAIAIQNALSIQEVKDLNENLQQRINDATKELRASNAQLQRLDKAKDEFVSMASHQLRTPLTSVKGYISMVLDGDAGKITEAQSRLLEEAFVSSERMVNLINDFLNMSRIQTGKFLIEKCPVDLSEVVKQEIDSLRPSAAARNLKFSYHAPKKFPLLDLDEGKIRQVIMNFSDNALYYARSDKPIVINLSVEGDEILFTVKDSGIGVPKSEQAQLFTKFYRATNARKQRPDGTGVGLYLAKRVVDAHNGQIVFESTEGKGSTFGFRLPNKPVRLTK